MAVKGKRAESKKNDLTEENVQASENENDNEINKKTEFPKIAARARIKAIIREVDLIKIRFKDFTFSPGQEKQLAEWMDNEDELIVTLEQYQGRL